VSKHVVYIRVSTLYCSERPLEITATIEAEDRFIAAEKVINDAKKVLEYNVPTEEAE
jgi:hypothetical protein